MQITMDRKKAYTEILEILRVLGENYSRKIPNNVKDYFESNAEKNYEFKISPNINISQQIQNPITINLLGLLRFKYWCNTDEEKQELLNTFIKNNNEKKLEIEEKYDSNDIFKNREKKFNINVERTQNTSIMAYKQSLFSKILNMLRYKLFRKK